MSTLERWIDYFQYRRRDEIQKYCTTTLPYLRKDYRSWALHYGRLVRKMEREQ